MTEQEMNLDTAIQLFNLVNTYEEYREGLGEVLNASTKASDPNEARERVMEVINAKKADLMETNPEFKAIMDANIRENKQRADYNRAIHKAKKAEAKASMARSEAMSRVRSARGDVDDFVARTRFKTVDPEELEKKLEDKLGCPNPKCEDYGRNRRNVMNDIPTCMRCWHRLVPKSEFKDYNRKYWRRYNKKRKK